MNRWLWVLEVEPSRGGSSWGPPRVDNVGEAEALGGEGLEMLAGCSDWDDFASAKIAICKFPESASAIFSPPGLGI